MTQSDVLRKVYDDQLKEQDRNGDSKGRAETLFQLAKQEVSEGNQEAALLLLMESYSRFQQVGDAQGHCFAGELLGQLLFVSGNREDGVRVIREALRGFKDMGFEEEAAKTEELLAAMKEYAGADS
ncbi:hypothetical protein [Maridesulfovibrio sp. FT414]|uniref:hypothetical protein n=1 Tax=Maridesulfovibrio sp. FT414 TaxID=2979469 RepID=UPI003D802010